MALASWSWQAQEGDMCLMSGGIGHQSAAAVPALTKNPEQLGWDFVSAWGSRKVS